MDSSDRNLVKSLHATTIFVEELLQRQIAVSIVLGFAMQYRF